MKARVALVLVVLVVAASLSTILARANHQNEKDRNDVQGLLDIRRVETFGRNKKPGWKIMTFSSMTAKALRDTGFFMVYLDTFGNSRFDYYALVSSKGSKMQGTLWRDPENKRDRRVGFFRVWRRNQRSVSLEIPLSKLNTGGAKRIDYRWFVKTLFTGDNCRRVCIDRAPNSDALVESNGKQSPSAETEVPETTESPQETPAPEDMESPEASPTTSPSASPTP
jgi:hypothetical protein